MLVEEGVTDLAAPMYVIRNPGSTFAFPKPENRSELGFL